MRTQGCVIEITVELAENSMRAVTIPNKSKLKPNNPPKPPNNPSIMPKNSTGERFLWDYLDHQGIASILKLMDLQSKCVLSVSVFYA